MDEAEGGPMQAILLTALLFQTPTPSNYFLPIAQRCEAAASAPAPTPSP